MVISMKHCVIPAILILAACGQDQAPQQAAVTPPQTTVEQVNPQSTGTSDQMAGGMNMNNMDMGNMDMGMGGMHDSSHMMGEQMVTHGAIQPALSNNGLFKASVTSELDPVVINQLHNWTLNLTTADGTPVENATINVTGNMPAHAHGMPTSPQVTANLGSGNYTVEGMQFQMGGEWEVTFNVTSGPLTDDVVFRFTLQ